VWKKKAWAYDGILICYNCGGGAGRMDMKGEEIKLLGNSPPGHTVGVE
jgi:hypothetical protein